MTMINEYYYRYITHKECIGIGEGAHKHLKNVKNIK